MTFGKTVNLGNSIIGVSILAMPYCFVQSGILLSILLIVLSGFLTRLSCHFLLKSAFISRRRSFELMVHDVLGSTGRFLVEIGLIGFLLGTCVAYFIMIGDLAPKILAELFDLRYNRNLRIITILFLSLFVALPLSLLKRVDSLTSFSLLSMLLYSCLILKLMFETTDKLMIDNIMTDQFEKVSYWNISGLLTTFPIFSMAMSCQTSLFEIFDSSVITNDLDTIKRDNGIIKQAIYMCSFVYITVGLLGYMAFHDQTLYGNILLAFPPSLTTTLTKIGFIVTLLMSFPLCLFPCRTSVHSLTNRLLLNHHFKKSATFQALPTSAPTTTTTFVKMSSDLVNSNLKYNLDTSPLPSTKDNNCNSDNNNNNSDQPNGTNGGYQKVDSSTKHHRSSLTNQMKIGHQYQFSGNSKKTNSFASLLNYEDDVDDEDEEVDNRTGIDQITNVHHHQNGGNIFAVMNSHSPTRLYISDLQFRLLTIVLIVVTVILSLMFPHIEFILGIIGSTAGTTVCFVLPAYTFIRIGEHSKTELFLARLLLLIGLAILIFCTYSTSLQDHVSQNVPDSSAAALNK